MADRPCTARRPRHASTIGLQPPQRGIVDHGRGSVANVDLTAEDVDLPADDCERVKPIEPVSPAAPGEELTAIRVPGEAKKRVGDGTWSGSGRRCWPKDEPVAPGPTRTERGRMSSGSPGSGSASLLCFRACALPRGAEQPSRVTRPPVGTCRSQTVSSSSDRVQVPRRPERSCPFAGLVPSEYSSAEHTSRG